MCPRLSRSSLLLPQPREGYRQPPYLPRLHSCLEIPNSLRIFSIQNPIDSLGSIFDLFNISRMEGTTSRMEGGILKMEGSISKMEGTTFPLFFCIDGIADELQIDQELSR